ncbi:hypothetical protein [Lutimonas sp.]|uniref:hypothetical protein n=1 Tax=Lutimonas sp. TaxID=1872403 RepID=UPI003C7328CA
MNTFFKTVFMFIMIIGPVHTILAQEDTDEKLKHHHVVLTIGHSHIPSGSSVSGSSDFILIPTWGFSYEYIFTERIALGLKSDLEVSNYVITDNDETEVERENPFSTSLIFSYIPIKGLGIFTGPGIEFEKEENYFIYTIGLSYEIEFGKDWDLSPELAYEIKGGHTGAISFGLSVGKKFGK